jgi:hypothetical protein
MFLTLSFRGYKGSRTIKLVNWVGLLKQSNYRAI